METTIDGRYLIAIIADEETTIGFLMAGIGETSLNSTPNRNYLIVTKDTSPEEIETFYTQLIHRKNIAVILIGAEIYKNISHISHKITRQLPIILQVPTKGFPSQNNTTE